MERPYRPYEPHPPSKPEKKWYVDHKYIYQYGERIWGDDEQDYDGQEEEEENKKRRKYPEPSDITLAWLISKLPEGITPEQVKVNFSYEARSHYAHSLGFYYEVQNESHLKSYEKDLEKYQQQLIKYKTDLENYKEGKKKYDEWQRQDEIKKAEKRLKELKGEK